MYSAIWNIKTDVQLRHIKLKCDSKSYSFPLNESESEKSLPEAIREHDTFVLC